MTTELPVVLGGVVTPYSGNGRKLGYPTANIAATTSLADGVYFGFASVGIYKNRPALIFIGVPTSVGDSERRVEAHVLDAKDKDYYGAQMTVSVEQFHRSNQTFSSVDKLVEAMKADETAGRAWADLHQMT